MIKSTGVVGSALRASIDVMVRWLGERTPEGLRDQAGVRHNDRVGHAGPRRRGWFIESSPSRSADLLEGYFHGDVRL